MSAELTQIVAEHFRPEFVNRIDEIVVFNNLEKSQIKSISVKRPSSSTCKRILNTSGCAFSTSSSSMIEYGFLRTASVSTPPQIYLFYLSAAFLLEHTSSPPFFLEEQELPIL
jgi:capsular polysaccharide biosynthesis protein